MSKTIASVGFHLTHDSVTGVNFNSHQSLIDWDIILFTPDISSLLYRDDGTYLGKQCLGDDTSFRLREACEHWRRELQEAVSSGKTVIGFLCALTEVYIATGEKEFSGTGRNRHTTRMVTKYSNYQSIPIPAEPISRSGSAIKVVEKYSAILTPYWEEFHNCSKFSVTFPKNLKNACLVTRHGDIPVGLLLLQKTDGALLLLPELHMDFAEYADCIEDDADGDNGEESNTEDFKRFSAKLVANVVALDKALRSRSTRTPEPSWTSQPTFSLSGESEVIEALLAVESQLEEARVRKDNLIEKRKEEASLRDLLFETGQALELAVLKALTLLGFSAEKYRDDHSEFDVIFQCDDGRLLGEVEGRNTKAISIDKLRQLSMNIHEDLSREEVEKPAKAILFGNAYRLQEPASRVDAFTDKCIKAAESTSTGLVDTVQLFRVVQYLSHSCNENFARKCRLAILSGNGLVVFPETPEPPNEHRKERMEAEC